MTRHWFTSDHHFGHENIIKYNNRPFESVKQMDELMAFNWNRVIKPEDTVYHLGDFTLGGPDQAAKYFYELNGHIKVLDNPWHHDKRWLLHFDNVEYLSNHGKTRVERVLPIVVLEFSGLVRNNLPQVIVMCHYPMAVWDRKHYGSWHIHGHTHKNYKASKGEFIYDVGVDNTYYQPVSLEWLVGSMQRLQRVPYNSDENSEIKEERIFYTNK